MHIGITISALWGLLEAWSQELMTSSWTEETLKDPLLLLLLLPAELADVVLIRRTGPHCQRRETAKGRSVWRWSPEGRQASHGIKTGKPAPNPPGYSNS